ncbi:MAG TPA: prolyl-tRNA synthetase associated domain-containing protein [Candidatus Agathobaculum merdavium]|nr:prolyl-tRNA synthetase associated domain-containing protein [Candidatus Agathobaculum merdavium]
MCCQVFCGKAVLPSQRVDHDETPSIEACGEVEKLLGIEICKNLFLCNRQKTQFTLLLMPGRKEFRTKELSAQLGCSRLSFADAERMQEFLGVTPGSVSVLGLLNDTEKHVRLVIDRDALAHEYFGCPPCRNTTSLRIKTADLTGRILPALGHEPTYVNL